jgi:hypothetical protein
MFSGAHAGYYSRMNAAVLIFVLTILMAVIVTKAYEEPVRALLSQRLVESVEKRH